MKLLRRPAVIIFILSAAVRMLMLVHPPSQEGGAYDSGSWVALAQSLLAGQGFYENGNPVTVRPPVYPLFLASVYYFTGPNDFAVRLLQILLSALTAVFLFFIAKKLLGEKIAWIAGLACAVYPPLIIYSAIISSETLFIFLAAASVLFLFRGLESGAYREFVISGILLGAAHLCRSILTLYPFFLMALAILLRKGWKEIGGLAIVAVLSFLVVMPWTLRNYGHFKGFMLINVGAGQALWLGNLQETNGRYVGNDHPAYRQFDAFTADPNDGIKWEHENFRVAVKNIKSDLPGFFKLTAKKFIPLWFDPIGGQIVEGKSQNMFYLLVALHAAFILLAFGGAAIGFGDLRRLYPLHAMILYFGTTHLVLFPMPRFRLPFEPFLIIFAAIAVVSFFQKTEHAV